jgi:hypothetical protein
MMSLLREHARLNDDLVREVTARKLTSGQDHRARARERVQQRYDAWDNQSSRTARSRHAARVS